MLDAINTACLKAELLLRFLKGETDDNWQQIDLAALQAEFVSALAQVLDLAKQNQAELNDPNTCLAFAQLEALISEIRNPPSDTLGIDDKLDSECRYQRAVMLFNLGHDSQARQEFTAVLSAQADHFGALNDLGVLLMENSEYSLARNYFMAAVKAHPTQITGHLNFADFLILQCDYVEAIKHYQIALELDSRSKKAHQGLAHAFANLGDTAQANRHRELGFKGESTFAWNFRGHKQAIPLLLLGSAYGGNIPLNHVLDKHTFQSTVILTEYFEAEQTLPEHKLIVNLIGDADLSLAGLDAAERIVASGQSKVINHPALVRPSTRLVNAIRFGKIAHVKTPNILLLKHTELLQPGIFALLAQHKLSFPLLLRCPGFHTGQYFVRVEHPDYFFEAVKKLPGSALLVISILDSTNIHGDSHKFRVMIVDGQLYPMHLAISKDWKVHYFSADMETEPEYRKLEAQFLEDMPNLLGQQVMQALEHIRLVLGLDYAGIDFGINNDGEVLLFEANATMLVRLPENIEKWHYRRPAIERILAAVRQMILSRISE